MDYVLMPEWVHNIADIHSGRISEFLYSADIKDKKIDMKFLREYYKKGSETFNMLVSELAVRGFGFYSSKPNNVLPKFKVSNDEKFIMVKENKGLYKNFDFELFGLGNFLSRFGVEDDRFFNMMPVRGFEYLNPSIDIELLKDTLRAFGYNISGYEEADDSQEEFKEILIDSERPLMDPKEPEPEHQVPEVNPQQEREQAITVTDNRMMEELAELLHEIGPVKALAYIVQVTKDSITEEDSRLLYVNAGGYSDVQYKKESIDVVFGDVSFVKFTEFCRENNIKYCSQLNSEILMNFKNQRGVGIGKYTKVMETLKQYTEVNQRYMVSQCSGITNFEKHKYDRITIHEEIFNVFKDVHLENIGLLYKLQVPEGVKTLKLKDVKDKRFGYLVPEDDYKTMSHMINEINSVMLPKDKLLAFMEDEKNKRDMEVFEIRYKQGKTLNEAGIIFNITRERVRQIQKKAVAKVNNIFQRTKVVDILKAKAGERKFCTKDQVLSVLGKGNEIFINIVASGDINELFYIDKLQLYSFLKEELFEKAQMELASMLPEVFRLEDYYEEIKGFLFKKLEEELETEIILNMLDSMGYIQYGNIFSKGRLAIVQALEIIFMYYIDKPFLVDEEGFETLKRIAKKEMNFSFNPSFRSVDARIRDVENIILIDNRTFIHISRISYNQEIFEEIDDYLEEIKQHQEVINIQAIYEHFYDRLGELKQYTKYALYSLLRIHLGDKYKVGGGNTLDIYLDKSSGRITREMTITEYLRGHGGTAFKKDVLRDLHWMTYKLDDTVAKSNKIISWGRDRIMLMEDIKVSVHIKEQFKKVLDSIMTEGYTSSKLVLEESVFFGDLGRFIAENDLNDKFKINGFLKCIFNNLKGNTVFLYDKDSRFTNIYDVIYHKYSEGINRAELSAFLQEMGYEEMVARSMYDELVRDGKYIEISMVDAVAADKFVVDSEFAEKLKNEIYSRMEHREYISLSNLEGIRRALPTTSFRLNPHFYKSVLIQNGFRPVIKYNCDYRYDKVIVVRETSNIDTFEDLVYHILKTEYSGDMHESRIYDFLTAKGIVKEQEFLMDKKLPAGIYRHDSILIDELGFVELVGGES